MHYLKEMIVKFCMLQKYPILSIFYSQFLYKYLFVKYPRTHQVEVTGIESHPTPARPPKVLLCRSFYLSALY